MFSHWKSVRSLGYRFRVVLLITTRVTTARTSPEDDFLDGQ
jgi:hypothetical protein